MLQPFLDEAGHRLQAAGLRDPASLSNPLGMQRGLPLLIIPGQQTLLIVQCLINQLMLIIPTSNLPSSDASVASEASAGGTAACHDEGHHRVVAGAVAFWKGHLLWGNLPLRELEALTLLAGRALGPALSMGRVGGIQSDISSKVRDCLRNESRSFHGYFLDLNRAVP